MLVKLRKDPTIFEVRDRGTLEWERRNTSKVSRLFSTIKNSLSGDTLEIRGGGFENVS